MDGAYAFLIAIVFFVIVLNFFMLFMQLRRNRSPKTGRVAMDEKKAAELRAKEIQRRLDREQEDAARQVELRNKTLDLFDQVRKNAAEAERESTTPLENSETDC